MKKRLAGFLLVLFVVAATAYGLARFVSSRKTEDQWTWLRREFRLSDAQYSRVLALHEAYQPICADHCNHIMAVQKRMAELEQSGAKASPAYAAAQTEWQAIIRQCNRATLQHLEKVAKEMDPGEGRRYLDLMVPRITRRDHRGLSDVE
jgi:hypothetical protein